jgi:hypothetical protein
VKEICEAVHKKCLNFFSTIGFATMTMLQPTRHSVEQFLAQKLIDEMEHPHCFPDLAQNDFQLFPQTKFALKGRM